MLSVVSDAWGGLSIIVYNNNEPQWVIPIRITRSVDMNRSVFFLLKDYYISMYALLKALQYIFCFYQLSDLIQFQIKFHFHLMSARNANACVWDCDVIEFGGQHLVG